MAAQPVAAQPIYMERPPQGPLRQWSPCVWVRRSLEAAANLSVPDWSRIAAEQGYADQAHLNRQVRRWSGATPRELAAQRA